jgi:hypothetical protein
MDLVQLQTRLRALGVRPKETYRASLYIDYLNLAEAYFKNVLSKSVQNGGLGDDYPFVANALTSANLLQELADLLDFFVAPAVDADLRRAYAPPPGLGHGGPGGWTYQNYFTGVILNANDVTFGNNITAFRTRYPITAAAFEKLAANFERNIFQSCRRIIADKTLLTAFYRDLYEDEFSILSLQKIKSTGSDFHKGGKQVLILTFAIVHTVDYGPPIGPAPTREELKVVYKPSDLEVDCLILGDSAVVNRVLGPPNFMAASLFEIYNQRLHTMKANDPAFTGEPLTTYRILPRNYISAYNAGGPVLPIRNAYGYIQYLDNDVSGTAAQVFGYYPFGASDYLIFKTQSKNEITKIFYRQEGALAAVCCSFSIEDMHVENVRVMKYAPYLIDLEISLTSIISDIFDTRLSGANGGITGVSIMGQDYEWGVSNIPGSASIGRIDSLTYYQNRLWFAIEGRQKTPIAVSRQYLLQGFADGMSVLQTCQQNGDFNVWFGRLNNVLVRYLAYGTSDFKRIRSKIFIDQLLERAPAPGAALADTQEAALRSFLTGEYDAFARAKDPTANPDFVTLTQTECGPDYLNLDIPVFYYRIGSTAIIDSRGADVPIPPEVVINRPGVNPVPPTRRARVTGVGGIFNRATFFNNLPMQTNVQQGQVQILGDGRFATRRNQLRATITQALGNNAGNSPTRLISDD